MLLYRYGGEAPYEKPVSSLQAFDKGEDLSLFRRFNALGMITDGDAIPGLLQLMEVQPYVVAMDLTTERSHMADCRIKFMNSPRINRARGRMHAIITLLGVRWDNPKLANAARHELADALKEMSLGLEELQIY